MIETYLTKVNKEELQNVTPLAGVSKERTPYLVYKQYRYAYITEEDCLVTREAVTYPQLKSILSKRKEGFVFTLEESDALTELLNIPEEEEEEKEMVQLVEKVLIEPEVEKTPEVIEEVERLTDGLLAQEGFLRESIKFDEQVEKEEKERVDVSVPKNTSKKKQNRKKKNQA